MEEINETSSQKKVSEYEERILADIQEIKFNLHLLMRSSRDIQDQSSLNFVNPIEEIPALFGQGKLGFSVIVQSVRAWLRFKLRKSK